MPAKQSNVIEANAECGECGQPLPLTHVGPCPSCASTRRHINASDEARVAISERIHWVKTREYFENRPVALTTVIFLTLISPFIGLLIAGIPGALIGLGLSLFCLLLGFRARTKVRDRDHGGT